MDHRCRPELLDSAHETCVLDLAAGIQVRNDIAWPGPPNHALVAISAKQLGDINIVAGRRDVRAPRSEHKTMAIVAAGRRLEPIGGGDGEADLI
jgi:hypothetical protein